MSTEPKKKKGFDTTKALKRYREMSNNSIKLHGIEHAIVHYKNKKKIHTVLIPATWSMVFAYALANALLITGVRLVWQETIGLPNIEKAYQSTTQYK